MELVANLGNIESDTSAPSEEEQRWLNQGRDRYQDLQPDVFEAENERATNRMEQAIEEIKEGPTSADMQKTANEAASFIITYFKLMLLLDKYIEQSGIDASTIDKAQLLETYLARRETEGGYKGGFEKFETSKHFYDTIL